MKVYLDQSVIEEWRKFQLRVCPGEDHEESNIQDDLHAFRIILERASELCIEFMVSPMNDLERSSDNESFLGQFISKYSVKKVPSVGISICMIGQDQGLLIENLPKIGKAQSSGARKIISKRIRNAADVKKVRREKFSDFIHIDAAIEAGADFLLTIDGPLLRNNVLSDRLCNEKLELISPKDFCNKYFSK